MGETTPIKPKLNGTSSKGTPVLQVPLSVERRIVQRGGPLIATVSCSRAQRGKVTGSSGIIENEEAA